MPSLSVEAYGQPADHPKPGPNPATRTNGSQNAPVGASAPTWWVGFSLSCAERAVV